MTTLGDSLIIGEKYQEILGKKIKTKGENGKGLEV